MFPQRWTLNVCVGLCPSSVQRGGAGVGQSGPGLLGSRAEAPRQRPGNNAGRPIWIWPRTESVYGILVNPNPGILPGPVKPNPYPPWERCRLIRTGGYHFTVLSASFHPGKRRDLSPNRELLGTFGRASRQPGNRNCMAPAGYLGSNRRHHSSRSAGEPRTWRRVSADPMKRPSTTSPTEAISWN